MSGTKQLPLQFSTVTEVNDFFNTWHRLSELNRLTTIKKLKDCGSLTVIKAPSAEHSCPLHGFPLAKPCSLTSCSYHLRGSTTGKESADLIGISSKFKNCLMGYINESKSNKLGASEISVLMGKSTSEINGLVASAVVKLRKAMIREKIEKMKIVRYSYLPGHCVSCEVSIHDELCLNTLPQELTIEWEKFGWCTKECKLDRPEWQFKIEHEFRCSYVDAVAAAITVYSPEEVFGILGVPEEESSWLISKATKRLESLQK